MSWGTNLIHKYLFATKHKSKELLKVEFDENVNYTVVNFLKLLIEKQVELVEITGD